MLLLELWPALLEKAPPMVTLELLPHVLIATPLPLDFVETVPLKDSVQLASQETF